MFNSSILFTKINFNSEKIDGCATFDVDVIANTVKCVQGGFNTDNDDEVEGITNRGITVGNTNGPIIPLGKYYPLGIKYII